MEISQNSSKMTLFEPEYPLTVLDNDGLVRYHGCVFELKYAHQLFQSLLNEVPWENDEVVLFGKRIVTARKIAWFADHSMDYRYSNSVKKSLEWNDHLLQIKKQVEIISGTSFNSCLANLYHNGSEGMAYHRDNEPELIRGATIASVSFGAERDFLFKHNTTNEVKRVFLESGSLLTMENETQDFWKHRLPPTKKVHTPRINLTFRCMNVD